MIVSCKRCSRKFYIKPSHKKLGWGIYCSRICTDLDKRKGKVVKCKQCLKRFYIQPKRLRKSKLFFCTKNCYLKYKAIHLVGSGHPGWKNGESAYLQLMRKKVKQFCKRCELKHRRVLVVHHIDKNRKNNILSNLIWLCRNCHFLVHKYKETW